MSNNKSYPERFFDKVTKTDTCWLWTGCTNGRYGYFRYLSKNILAHRYSYLLHFQILPPKLLVCHTCDNPICINPSHLFLGTHRDNNMDALIKGRRKPLAKNWGNIPKNRALTNEKVIEIKKRLLAKNNSSFNQIALELNVKIYTVQKIHMGLIYKNIKL